MWRHFTGCLCGCAFIASKLPLSQNRGLKALSINHILILEEDRLFANQLIHALNKMRAFTITIVPTVKDACFYLVQSRQDVAFIPVHEGAKIIRSLRAVQPDLRLVLVTPQANVEIPQTYAGRVQAVLIKSLVDVELPTILQDVLLQPLVGNEDTAVSHSPAEQQKENLIESTLQQTKLGRLIHTVLVIHNQTLWGHWGDLTESEAATVALQIGSDWAEHNAHSRIQFMHIPARAGEILLYTQEVNEQGDLVTLAAVAETPISELRQQAHRMSKKLGNALKGDRPAQTSFLNGTGNVDGRTSYAIVWRPTEALPTSIHIPLRRAMERIAITNACILTHCHVQADVVHLVVNCPVSKESAWAAYLFKNGAETAIRQAYGVEAHLWETGFYATESSNPLSQLELNLFLENHPLEL